MRARWGTPHNMFDQPQPSGNRGNRWFAGLASSFEKSQHRNEKLTTSTHALQGCHAFPPDDPEVRRLRWPLTSHATPEENGLFQGSERWQAGMLPTTDRPHGTRAPRAYTDANSRTQGAPPAGRAKAHHLRRRPVTRRSFQNSSGDCLRTLGARRGRQNCAHRALFLVSRVVTNEGLKGETDETAHHRGRKCRNSRRQQWIHPKFPTAGQRT